MLRVVRRPLIPTVPLEEELTDLWLSAQLSAPLKKNNPQYV